MGCLKITENTGAIRLGKSHFFLGDTYEKKEVPQIFCYNYYPFGLSFNSYARAASTAQNFKFNAGSELEEMTDWYSTPFRKYDPSLGRFHGVDALSEWNMSVGFGQFAYNNPINRNDPTGLDSPDGDEETGGDSGGSDPGASADALKSTAEFLQMMRDSEFALHGYDHIASAEKGHGGSNDGVTSARYAVLKNNKEYANSTGIPTYGIIGHVVVGGYSTAKYGFTYNTPKNNNGGGNWSKWNRTKYRARHNMIRAYNKISLRAIQELSTQTYMKIDGSVDGLMDGFGDNILLAGDKIIYYGNEALDALGVLGWNFWKNTKSQSNANDRQSPDNINPYEKAFDSANSVKDLVDNLLEPDSVYIIATPEMTKVGTNVGDTVGRYHSNYRQ